MALPAPKTKRVRLVSFGPGVVHDGLEAERLEPSQAEEIESAERQKQLERIDVGIPASAEVRGNNPCRMEQKVANGGYETAIEAKYFGGTLSNDGANVWRRNWLGGHAVATVAAEPGCPHGAALRARLRAGREDQRSADQVRDARRTVAGKPASCSTPIYSLAGCQARRAPAFRFPLVVSPRDLRPGTRDLLSACPVGSLATIWGTTLSEW